MQSELQKNSIFSANSKTPLYVLFKIIRDSVVDGLNVKKIIIKFKKEYVQENIDPIDSFIPLFLTSVKLIPHI